MMENDYKNTPSPFRARISKTEVGAMENCCVEIYNKMDEDITFISNHPNWQNHYFVHPTTGIQHGPLYWKQAVCKPGEWVFLPHGLYNGFTKSGRPLTVVMNFGNEKFKGNKLPSRPEAKKVRVFGGR